MDPDLYAPEFQEDPYPCYAMLRRERPVYREPRYGAYVLTRFDDVDLALRDHETWRSGAGPAPMPMPGGAPRLPLLAATDPPQHDQLRTLVSRAFTPRRVAAAEPRISALARRLVDALPAEADFDLVPALSVPLPVAVIAEILGVDAGHQDDFRRWSDATVGLMEGPPSPEKLMASGEIVTYFRELAVERRKRPGDDLISDLLAAEIDGRRLEQDELDAFFVMLLVAGNETTTNLISNQLRVLAERPDLWKACREDRSLVPRAIEEALRFDSPVQNLGREASRDVELHDVRIPAGARLVVSFGAANRDPAVFESPDEYRLDRGDTRHLAFGQGRHFCLGAGLARLEGRVALDALLDRFAEIEPGAGAPRRLHSTVIRGFASLPLRGRTG